MCDPITAGVATFASQAAGAVGSFQSQQAQTDAANEASSRNYKHALMVREAKWYNQLANWNNQRTDYKKTLTENNLAAGRAYASEQERLNEQFRQAAFANQGALNKLLQSQGLVAAKGASGQSAQRSQVMRLAAYGRNNAIMAEQLRSGRNAMIMKNENTWYQHKSANNKAWNKVAMAPVQDIAPPQPVMAAGPSGLSLAAQLGGAALSGFNAYSSLKAPSGFTDPGTFNPNPGAAGIAPSGAEYFGPAFGNGYQPYIPFAN